MLEYQTRNLKTSDKNFNIKLKKILEKSKKNETNLYVTVSNIIREIQEKGDIALSEFVTKFDNIKIKEIKDLFISKNILKTAYDNLKKEEKNALHIAAQMGHLEIVRFLSENAVDRDKVTQDGATPINMAARTRR